MLLDLIPACAFEECLCCSHQHELWVTQRQPKNRSSCHPREGGRGEGGVGKCWDYRLTSAHHNIHAGAGSVPRCQVPPKLWCSIQSHSSLAGSCLQVLTLLSSSWGRDASFDLLRDLCRAKHLACPSRALGTLTSPPWAHRKCSQRRKCLCWNSLHPFAKQRQEGPCLAFPHLPQPMKWNFDYWSKL